MQTVSKPYDYCPSCGEFDPIVYDGDEEEPTIQECPECGWNVEVGGQR